ncbi:hypothetical protein ACFL53_00175 [Pseudomonadota bacterium]
MRGLIVATVIFGLGGCATYSPLPAPTNLNINADINAVSACMVPVYGDIPHRNSDFDYQVIDGSTIGGTISDHRRYIAEKIDTYIDFTVRTDNGVSVGIDDHYFRISSLGIKSDSLHRADDSLETISGMINLMTDLNKKLAQCLNGKDVSNYRYNRYERNNFS